MLRKHAEHVFSPQMRLLFPPCRRTPVSTIRQKYLISCPATRPAGPSGTDRVSGKPARPSRVAQRRARGSAMATCPEAPETRHLHTRPGTWSCVFRGRETPGGRGYSNMSQLGGLTLDPGWGHCRPGLPFLVAPPELQKLIYNCAFKYIQI